MKFPEKPPKAAAEKLLHILCTTCRRLLERIHRSLHLDNYQPFSCRCADPTVSYYYSPREVEFSCSNTPYVSFFHVAKRKRQHRYRHDAASVARAFEAMNSETAKERAFIVSPIVAADSLYPVDDEEAGATGSHVDDMAGEFIRRFYEQLRSQTPKE